MATIVTAFTLCGCYPTWLTSRPKAEILVTDESGAPLQGATVTLMTREWHGIVGRNSLEHFLTDRNGKVGIRKHRDWAIQVLLPDGGKSYSWSLCFSKPGFEAIPMVFMNFDQPIRVAMYPSAIPSQCQSQQEEGRLRVKEREARWIEVDGGEWRTHFGFAMTMDEKIRDAMESSARQQGIKLRSWSEYRFQYQARGKVLGDRRLFVHAFCRAPAEFDLTKSFYSEPDDRACFFDTTYTSQTYTNQPESTFSALQVTTGQRQLQ